MLDNLSIEILKHLKPYFLQDDPHFYNSDRLKRELIDYSDAEIRACLVKLSDDGFINLTERRSPIIMVIGLTHDGYHYEDHLNDQVPINSPVFNIGTVHNSAFGNTGNITINNDLSFDALKEFIKAQDIPESDKSTLLEMTDCVKTSIENGESLERGFLSKFSSVLKDYGPLAVEIVKTVIPYFFGLPS